MKRIFCILLAMLLSIPALCFASEDLDLSAMSFEELIALREAITKEITSRPEWKNVTVPAGVYEIGVDIPEGHWTITYQGDMLASVTYGKRLNDSKTDIDDWDVWEMLSSDDNTLSIELKSGNFIVIQSSPVVFTPYIRPSLGFDYTSDTVVAPSTIAKVVKDVKVRASDSFDSKLLGTAKKGEVLVVITPFYSDDWHQIVYNDKVGYVWAEYTKLSQE